MAALFELAGYLQRKSVWRALIQEAQRAMLDEHGPQMNTYTPRKWEAQWDWVHKIEDERSGTWRYLGVEVWMTDRG